MDRFRQKSRKEKPTKNVDRDKPPLYITDVKTIKENLKIKEILRTVKMNSSMRMKAPRGSKVMQNKDFNDNDDIFEDTADGEDLDTLETPSAVNPDVIVKDSNIKRNEEEIEDDLNKSEVSSDEPINDSTINDTNENNCPIEDTHTTHESPAGPEGVLNDELISQENKQDISVTPDIKIQVPSEYSHVKTRDRKLSLDQTMLSRREGLSQSELDLNSIGKSPLERKSSFFRKKMDSFLKNTTEIFKRQSISKSQSSIPRRGSMSVSLQSLNEDSVCNGDFDAQLLREQQDELQGSVTSLRSSVTGGRSNSSLSQSDRAPASPDAASLAGSQPALVSSQPLGTYNSDSINSLNEAYIQESLLNSRAISMSSGLDSAHGQDRRKANRSNRVTWLASEGLTNYLRRVIQDEKSREMQMCHSFQDFSSIPENNPYGPKTDSKGRRLSYQRAVSGEDPVSRYQDNSMRKKHLIPENSEAVYEISALLAEYSKNGVPTLKGFRMANIPDEALGYLQWAGNAKNIEEFFRTKKLPAAERARQAVISELVQTEADYINHIIFIVEVYIATAHALQDSGKLLNVETERLFSNIPDVLNASLYFWAYTIYPMLAEAVQKNTPFNTEYMATGFCRFRELFQPYEKFVGEQTKILDYLRFLSTNADFIIYATWCNRQKPSNKLLLSDILIKPMQRLTKYCVILHRIIEHTDVEPERTSLIAMKSFAKNYVLDLNRWIHQREELEILDHLATVIDTYDIDFKDEDLEALFRLYAQLNLKQPMVNCLPHHSRSLIYQGDLRYKDQLKEIEVRVFLLTDTMLICKKLSKGSFQFKLIRPKCMVDRMVYMAKYNPRNEKEVQVLVFAVLDELGSSYNAFSLTESTKDSKEPQGTLKVWEQKIREAKLTYELGVWYAKNPSRDFSEMDSSSDYAISGTSGPSAAKPGMKLSSEDMAIERDARERVATMLHCNMGVSTEYDISQASMITDSFDGEASGASAGRPPGLHSLRYPLKRASTGGSSRNSRLSSFQQSTSAASHDEPQPGPSRYNYKAGSSVEHVIPPQNPEDGVTSITVNVVSESEPDTVVETQQQVPQPPLVVLQHSSPHKSPMPSRSASASRNTLRVQPQNVVMALMHSLPDLTCDPNIHNPRPHCPSPQSASEQMYQSHQELLQRNRLSASQHHQFLKPNHRGTSYPPPSPTRASLKRGLAFSYSFKNPPLLKMGHVNSQSQTQSEPGPSTSHGAKGERGSVSPVPGTSADKGDKKSKQVNKNKGDSGSGGSRKDDKIA